MRRLAALVAFMLALVGSVHAFAAADIDWANQRKYECSWGMLNAGTTGPFRIGVGQSVDVVVTNNNVFFLALRITDQIDGTVQTLSVSPWSSGKVTFQHGSAEPTTYNISFDTAAESVVAKFQFKSYFCGRVTGPVTSSVANKCMDDYLSGTADGNKIVVWPCNGTDAQRWTWGYTTVGLGWDQTIRVFGKCLDVKATGLVRLWTCIPGRAAQVWKSAGDLTLRNQALCLTGGSKKDGTQLFMATCQSPAPVGQQWILPAPNTFLG
jgi:hypothetical protein